MGISGNFTLFKPTGGGGGGGSASGPYVQDAFLDISLYADTNNGFTSTVATNPSGYFFGNTDTPRFGLKTLLVKNLILLETDKWLDNKPTYEVIFNEYNPSIRATVVGNARLRDIENGKCVEIKGIRDYVSVTTVGRQVQWLLNPNTATTASVERLTDTVSLGSTNIDDLNPSSDGTGYNTYFGLLHDNGIQTENIHNYTLKANDYDVFSFFGVQVYFENATIDIEIQQGSTYLNKNKITTTANAQLPLPVVTSQLGARSAIAKNQNASYTLQTKEVPVLVTDATGNIGTNLINVTTGTGQSFQPGMGVVTSFGSSMYVGFIESISTDTLTVNPVLPFGVSNVLYDFMVSGPTYPITTDYTLSADLDLTNLNVYADPNGFGINSQGNYYFRSPDFNYGVYGDELTISDIEGYRGVGFQGATVGFLTIEGQFSAISFEAVGNGILHGTFSINGIPAWGINEGFTGILSKTIFTGAGSKGWNTISFAPGVSYSQVLFTKFNMYEPSLPGFSGSMLSMLDSAMDRVDRGPIQNATLTQLGNMIRVYSDEIYLKGEWTRGVTPSAAGGVLYYGSTTTATMNFNYYGDNFALLGTAGASAVLLVDGVSTAVTLNSVLTVPNGVTFHAVEYQHFGGTSVIEAIDFYRPEHIEMVDTQNYTAYESRQPIRTTPKVFNQFDTPRNPIDGDLWNRDRYTRDAWIYLFGVWNRLSLNTFSDDPNTVNLVISHGSTTLNPPQVTQDVQLFNFISWQTGNASTAGARYRFSNGDAAYQGFHYQVDGEDSAGNISALNQRFNKISWSSLANRSTPLSRCGMYSFNNFLYVTNGFDGANNFDTADKFNGVSWSNITSFGTAKSYPGSYVVNSLVCIAGGNFTPNFDTLNSADVASTQTGYPLGGGTNSMSNTSNVSGDRGYSAVFSQTQSYVWNGSTWSGNIAMPYTTDDSGTGQAPAANGYNFVSQLSYYNGGYDSANPRNDTTAFNGTAYSTSVASINARVAPTGSII